MIAIYIRYDKSCCKLLWWMWIAITKLIINNRNLQSLWILWIIHCELFMVNFKIAIDIAMTKINCKLLSQNAIAIVNYNCKLQFTLLSPKKKSNLLCYDKHNVHCYDKSCCKLLQKLRKLQWWNDDQTEVERL